MWLNCNLGKVNLETTLAGQRLNPRQVTFCGVATGSAGDYKQSLFFLGPPSKTRETRK